MTDVFELLTTMRSGAVINDINNKFRELLAAVLETAGPGELNIKLKMRPSKMGMGGAVIEVETEHEAKAKKPELAIGKAVFFVTKDGDLTRDDPSQEALFTELSKEVRRG